MKACQSTVSDDVSLVEYNRWLVTERKWTSAEEGRRMLSQMREYRKATQRSHLERGRQRAEVVRAQREEAAKKGLALQEHRRLHGSEVKAQVEQWNERLLSQRRAWEAYGSTVRSSLSSDKKGWRKQFEQAHPSTSLFQASVFTQ